MPKLHFNIKTLSFPVGILPLTLFALAATFIIVGGLIFVSTTSSDEQAIESQRQLVRHVISEERVSLTRQQADVVSWDDAVDAVSGKTDMAWIGENLGRSLFESFGHDLSFLLSSKNRPVMVMRHGMSLPLADYDRYAETLSPYVNDLRTLDASGSLAAYQMGRLDAIPSVSDIVLLAGKPAMISLMPVISNSGRRVVGAGSEFVHISVKYLNRTTAVGLGQHLLLAEPAFSTIPPSADRLGEIALHNRHGTPVAYFTWMPAKPGTAILESIAPAVISAVVVVALIVGGLLARLFASTREIEAGRTAAEHQAHHDPLTGLANRCLFEKTLAKALSPDNKRLQRTALLMVDLDRFKQVNDTLGHAAGDALIRQVPDRMRLLLTTGCTMARLGGDEFAIIIEDARDTDKVMDRARAIVSALSRPFQLAQSQAFIGASIGVCIAPQQAISTSEMVRKADIALYEAKAAGRNCVLLFEEEMAQAVERRLRLEEKLRQSLDRGTGLDVVYRPFLVEDGTELAGAEARLVWNDPELGTIEHDEFMPIAEGTGLLRRMGLFVLEQACRYGAANPGLRISVHMCPSQLRDPDFRRTVFAILERTGMAPRDLEIEIEERSLLDANRARTAALRAFRAAGINITLGGFGSGFQALHLLHRVGVNRIKLDGRFLSQLASAPDPEAIAHALLWLIRAIGVDVTADGVDTPEQKAFLDRIGCTSFRGNLYSPEGQAAWLRAATRYERNTKDKNDTKGSAIRWRSA